MAVDVKELLSQAKQLSTDKAEISQRAAASRAYYYAYHVCQVFSGSNSFPLPTYKSDTGGLHNRLIQQYLQYADSSDPERTKKARCVGHILARMREIRTHADYRLGDDFDENLAEELFMHISRVEEKLDWGS